MNPGESALSIQLDQGEYWWLGSVKDGAAMPFTRGSQFEKDLADPGVDETGLGLPANQLTPVMISSLGRVVSARTPFKVAFRGDHAEISGSGLTLDDSAKDLAGGYARMLKLQQARIASPQVTALEAPQYNTWIEIPRLPTQEAVLEYARAILDHGLPPGCLIIDDNWASDFGSLRFDRARFPKPKKMVRQLHEMGFSVMLWLVPFISPDSLTFRNLEALNLVLRQADGQVAIRRWWNGYSALLDLTNPASRAWLEKRLDHLREKFGIDGFKFDGADPRDLRADDRFDSASTPLEFCGLWGSIATSYPLSETRASWRNCAAPLIQRVEDTPPSWDRHGIGSLIPKMITQSLTGHPYCCPDMIGGGEINAMEGESRCDEEFFVRYAQIAALAPVMQFSQAPWRVLGAQAFAAVKAAVQTRARYTDQLRRQFAKAGGAGLPILRPLAWAEPQLAAVTDQFMLGDEVVVAPVVERGARQRQVYLPAGSWRGEDGKDYRVSDCHSPITLPVELETLPIFVRING